MRVAFLSSYVGIGGGESSLLGLFGALDRSRVDPVLVCRRDGLLPQAARRIGVEVHEVRWRGASVWFHPAAWAASPAVGRITRCLEQLAPEVVHTDYHALPYVAAACTRLDLPVVFTCYGWWFKPKPWQRRFYLSPRLTVVFISDAVRRGFLEGAPWPVTPRHEMVHLGVDPGRYRPRPDERPAIRASLGLRDDAPLVTMVARFQRVKGHDVFLAMARLVAARRPGTQFVIAGENAFGVSADERFKHEVLDTARADAVLRDQVRFVGWTDEPERLIAASDVVVCSSRFESFGMVHVEAMATETPVVSTDVGAPAETVVDGDTGFLVPPDRADLLADRVDRLLGDADLRASMGRAGRARVREHFTVARYAARFAEVIEAARREAA